MNIREITTKQLNELNYPGNIGIMEVVKFRKIATADQLAQFYALIKNKDEKAAWELIQSVTGDKLQGK